MYLQQGLSLPNPASGARASAGTPPRVRPQLPFQACIRNTASPLPPSQTLGSSWQPVSHTPGTGWAQSNHTWTWGNTHPCKEAPRCAEVGTTSPASKCLHPVRAAPQSSGLYSTKSTWKASLQSPHFCPLHGVQGVPQTPSLLPESSWAQRQDPALAPGPYDSPNASFLGARH